MQGDSLRFPEGFLWGVSTSAHQVEGGLQDNNWAEWERKGRIRTGEVAGRACDWWHHAERDFDLAQSLGLNALRISVEWSRVEPKEGRYDLAALERYREMVSGLRARGIRPFVTLHHFTNPLWLERKGGFLWEHAPRAFELFTQRVVDALGDLCTDWVTFNEPNVYASMGYVLAEFPPGGKGDLLSAGRVLVSMLQSHARAYRVLHRAQANAQVGFTQNIQQFAPQDPERTADRWMTAVVEGGFNDAFLRGLEGGPMHPLRALWRRIGEAAGTYDFVGFNHYGWMQVAFDSKRPQDGFLRLDAPEGMIQGDRGVVSHYGGFDPKGLLQIAERLQRMGKPIYVLEHGVPDRADRLRPWLIARAAEELHRGIAQGLDLRGYFHWTLVDNFEWAEGWGLRFGLFELDPATQRRTPRQSAELFSRIAKANALSAEDRERYASNEPPPAESAPDASTVQATMR